MLKVGTKVIVNGKDGEKEGIIISVSKRGIHTIQAEDKERWEFTEMGRHNCCHANCNWSFRVKQKPVVEVKRKAKVGEWIKIVAKTCPDKGAPPYENGDIIQVKHLCDLYGHVELAKNRACLLECEYVVLENYVKEEKKVDPKFKVGDIVRGLSGKYGITSTEMTRGKVVEVTSKDTIRIEIVEHEWYKGGTIFDVSAKEFELAPKPMRKWTDAEIQEAKAIIGEFFINGYHCLSYKNYENSRRGQAIVFNVEGKHGIAKCCPTDDWNYYIGTMVALCKATGRELPKWIKNKVL